MGLTWISIANEGIEENKLGDWLQSTKLDANFFAANNSDYAPARVALAA